MEITDHSASDPDYDRREPGTLQPQREYYQKNRCADLRKENHRLKNMFSEPNVSAVAGSFFMHQRRDKEYGPQISDSVR